MPCVEFGFGCFSLAAPRKEFYLISMHEFKRAQVQLVAQDPFHNHSAILHAQKSWNVASLIYSIKDTKLVASR
jgi:hypothetical protein